MNIEEAIQCLKEGKKIRKKGWPKWNYRYIRGEDLLGPNDYVDNLDLGYDELHAEWEVVSDLTEGIYQVNHNIYIKYAGDFYKWDESYGPPQWTVKSVEEEMKDIFVDNLRETPLLLKSGCYCPYNCTVEWKDGCKSVYELPGHIVTVKT